MIVKTGLFDPFFSAAKDALWKHDASKPHAIFRVSYTNTADEAASLGKQFATGAPGWHAALISIPGFLTAPWAVPSKAIIIENLIRPLLPPVHNGLLMVLPTNQLLLLMQHIHGADLSTLIHTFLQNLTPESPPATVHPFDLTHPNPAFLKLCETLANPIPVIPPPPPTPALSPDQLTTFKLDANQLKIRRDRPTFRALIIEDDPATALLLSQLISGVGQISVAHDAVSAIATYTSLVPNLVFLDIGLPDVDGLTLAQRITSGDPAAFVVMITANAFKSNLDAALTAGAKGFIAKPFNRDHIQRYLAQAQTQTYR